jgi:hypothetical protein
MDKIKKRILLIIGTLIISIFLFLTRWEHGPVQYEEELMIKHKKDRWTSDSWVVLYGRSNGYFYSNEERPVLPEDKIHILKNDFISSQDTQERLRELEGREDSKNNEQYATEESYHEYLKGAEFISKMEENKSKGLHFRFELVALKACQWEEASYEFREKIKEEVGKQVSDEYYRHCELRTTYTDITDQGEIKKNAETYAKTKLSKEIHNKRSLYSYIGFSILILQILLLLFQILKLRSAKQPVESGRY